MDYIIFESEYEKDYGWVDIILVKTPPNGLKGFIQLKEIFELTISATKLYQNAKILPYTLVEKAYFGRAEFLVATLENPEIIKVVKRDDVISTVKMQNRIPKKELKTPEIPDEIVEIIKLDIKLDGLFPSVYADIENYYKIQAGYRFNPISGNCLVSNRNGDWQENWYVFALNSSDDPFYIDFTQKEVGFPVYFSFHGAGNWKPIKVTATLEQFKGLLILIHNIEHMFYYHLDFEIDVNNEFWHEVDKALNFSF